MNKNEWVDENYVREIIDNFLSIKENKEAAIKSISFYDNLGMKELVDLYRGFLDLDFQLNKIDNEGCVIIAKEYKQLQLEEPIMFQVKKIDGRFMFKEIK